MSKSKVVLFGFVLALVAQANPERTSAEYWRDVGLSFNLIKGEVNTQDCHEDQRTFIACVHAIGAMLSLNPEPLTLLPEARIEGNPRAGAVRRTFGNLRVVVHQPPAPSTNIMATMRQLRADRDANHRAWVAVWDDEDAIVPFTGIMNWIESTVVPRSEVSYLTATGLNGFLGAYFDPHTYIKPRAQSDDENRAGDRTFFGVGVNIRSVQNQVVIVAPVAGGPAHRAGVRARDILTRVNGTAVTNVNQASTLIRGENGTDVTLTLQRGTQTVELRVARGPIVRRNVEYSVIAGETRKKLGVIKLSDFVQGNPVADLQNAITDLESQHVDAFVFDLRNNPGGRLNDAIAMLGDLLGEAHTVLRVHGLVAPFNFVQEIATQNVRRTNLPMATLINASSASASEIMAGVLQEFDRSLIIGARSFGKGTVQNIGPWGASPQRVLFARTMSRYDFPSGNSPQLRSVLPDVVAYDNPNPTEEDMFAMREEDLYANAIPSVGTVHQRPAERRSALEGISNCTRDSGLARARFQAAQKDAIPPDYQLLVAQDALVCEAEK